MTPASTTRVSLQQRVAAAAAGEVAAWADEVDRLARFPSEAVAALRAAGAWSAGVPVELGGEGASLRELCEAMVEIGRACGATATVFAMHQIQVACLSRHTRTAEADAFLRRVATEQLLIASCTTELGKGGDVRASTCAVTVEGDTYSLEKQAPVISFGEHADAVLVTARRTPDSAANEQVLVLCEPPGLTLTPTSTWDALGYRGSCSRGFVLTGSGPVGAVQPDDFGLVSARTMVPYTHLLWAASWVGLAGAAATKARAFVQAQARRQPGTLPLAAPRLAELMAVLQQLTALYEDALRLVESAGPEELDSFATAIRLNALKVSGSALVLQVVSLALLTIGMAGYASTGPFSLSRLLRDAHGAALMLSNDRLVATNAQLLMAARGV